MIITVNLFTVVMDNECFDQLLTMPVFWVFVFAGTTVVWMLIALLYVCVNQYCCTCRCNLCRCYKIMMWREKKRQAKEAKEDEDDTVEFNAWAVKQEESQECTQTVKGDDTLTVAV